MRALLLALAVALFVAGCGDDSGGETTTTGAETMTVKVYYLRDGKVWPVAREIEVDRSRPDQAAVAVAAAGAVFELRQGPIEAETDELGLTTALPGSFADVLVVDRVTRFDPGEDLSEEALAQLVYTLTQFREVEAVAVNGEKLTRSDFEERTPSVLVESPLAFEQVRSPLRAEGTANTFEANFHYEITDTDGLIVDENFVTATSGTGTRGTFEFTTKPYTVPFDGIGSLIVFERSAEDGSRMNIVEIPLRMSR